MKLKPIEPGCLAVIIRSDAGNEGKVVRVLKYIGKIKGFAGADYWETDTPINSTIGEMFRLSRESCMMRIDGEDFSHEEREEAEEIRHNLLKFEYLVGK